MSCTARESQIFKKPFPQLLKMLFWNMMTDSSETAVLSRNGNLMKCKDYSSKFTTILERDICTVILISLYRSSLFSYSQLHNK